MHFTNKVTWLLVFSIHTWFNLSSSFCSVLSYLTLFLSYYQHHVCVHTTITLFRLFYLFLHLLFHILLYQLQLSPVYKSIVTVWIVETQARHAGDKKNEHKAKTSVIKYYMLFNKLWRLLSCGNSHIYMQVE